PRRRNSLHHPARPLPRHAPSRPTLGAALGPRRRAGPARPVRTAGHPPPARRTATTPKFTSLTTSTKKEPAIAAFPPITHVAVTVTDLKGSTRWYGELLAAERSWTKTTRPTAFTTPCSRSARGSYSACIPTPRPQPTPSTSAAAALITLRSLAATATSC